MAKRYHVSQDGVSRVCAAKTVESCTAIGVDGESAPHGEFANAKEASRFAEAILEKNFGADSLSSKAKPVVSDRPAYTTDMSDDSEYRVEGGRLVAYAEGEDFDLGELREISTEEMNRWSQETFSQDASFQDGEIFPVYDEDGDEAGAFARFGDKYYRAGTGNSFYQVDGEPSSADSGSAPQGPLGTPTSWPMGKEEFDSRFDQGMFSMASEGDSADQWIIEERDEDLMAELKSIEGLPSDKRQVEFDEIMDEWGGGYLLKDGRTIRYKTNR